jgi:5'-methylthioadenosine phosphorylase
MEAEIGIIGGSGVYDPAIFQNVRKIRVSTPYGATSDHIHLGELNGRKVAFLARHGEGHWIPPHSVNYRANIWAMKELGVTRIISTCAVGSLQEEYKPGDFAFIEQFIDFTKKREPSFFTGGKVYHFSCAEPFCPELRGLFSKSAKELKLQHHDKGTYVCIEGPRYSTKAESAMFRQFAQVIGMTLVPEIVLARELNLCYGSVAMVTDYDVWKEHCVTHEEVTRVMAENSEKIKALLKAVIPKIPKERKCECKDIVKE